MTILNTIVESKRLQFPNVSETERLQLLKAVDKTRLQFSIKGSDASACRGDAMDRLLLEDNPFVKNLLEPGLSIIGEIKPGSPSAGKLLNRERLPEILNIYRKHCAAISVLTDEEYFNGSFDLLAEVKRSTGLPVLCKDFIVSEEQIILAKKHGADAVLLIVKILKRDELVSLLNFALNVGLCPVVEVNNLADLEAIAELPIRVVLINNRNLDTMQIDLATTNHLAHFLKEDQIIISASGIKTKNDIQKLLPSATRFLIGTSLMSSPDPESLLRDLKDRRSDAPSIKVCGITNSADAIMAVDAGADFIGMILTSSSKRQVSLSEAHDIRRVVGNRAKVVGVFQNQNLDEVNQIANELILDFIQLHGEEDSEFVNACAKPVIKVFRYPFPKASSPHQLLEFIGAKFFLFDLDKESTIIESSDRFSDLNSFLAPVRNEIPPIFLAGKLSPDNVQAAALAVLPFALDVASGVELSPGIKSHTLTKQFCDTAKSKSQTHAPQVVNK